MRRKDLGAQIWLARVQHGLAVKHEGMHSVRAIALQGGYIPSDVMRQHGYFGATAFVGEKAICILFTTPGEFDFEAAARAILAAPLEQWRDAATHFGPAGAIEWTGEPHG